MKRFFVWANSKLLNLRFKLETKSLYKFIMNFLAVAESSKIGSRLVAALIVAVFIFLWKAAGPIVTLILGTIVIWVWTKWVLQDKEFKENRKRYGSGKSCDCE